MDLKKKDQFSYILWFLILSSVLLYMAQGDVHYHDFVLKESNFTRLCSTKSMLTVNDSFPGPEIRVHKGDTLYVNVFNEGTYGVTIHWHGVKQPRNPWFDGPEYITQCPIPAGTNFTYQVLFSEEEGTLWWHAHSDWTRATVHGVIIILPAIGTTYPFPKPDAEQTIVIVSIGMLHCPNDSCAGPDGNRLASALNNLTFANPSLDVLEAYYRNISAYYEPDFPNEPPNFFNFTAESLLTDNVTLSQQATKVKMLEYNETVEIVFQGTNVMNSGENHPMHLHGFRFYVVGRGLGNFDNVTDPLTYNLIDPQEVNTVPIPKDGWAAIRFKASNPGVWYMHCHFDRHMSWGMDTVFIVKNGDTEETSVRRPPSYMPPCDTSSLAGLMQSMFQKEE
ncbi:hypothetical protein L1049_026926 [Liquidambar formosana]|uniref:Laccase n=1 Tax=Liquidambar formosana TaxID=63359 RepID=A0AAP0R941_LIQFO